MITKVTKENKGLYKALFEKASNTLNEQKEPNAKEVKIETLDDYFAALRTLALIKNTYTVLPLDEPVFKIDTNTRKITVPAEFSKNGVSVQGDEISEVLYFTVDRYADAMDLAREDIHIAIQWETAGDAKNKATQGVSKEWIRDIETYKQDGKLLFGWAIDSNLTKRPGILKFSVRFYHLDGNDKIDFNLNTLAASVAISPSIDYEIINEVETSVGEIIDNTNLIMNRLINSAPPAGSEEAEAPVFLEGRDMPEGTSITYENGEPYQSVDLNNGKYDFSVKAVSTEGTVSYEWFHTPLGENENIVNTPPYSFMLTKDTRYSGEYSYYTLEEGLGETPVYKVVTDITSDMIGDLIERDEPLYERVGLYSATSAGKYRVKAINSNGLATEDTDGRWIVRIPGPGDNFVINYENGYQKENILNPEVSEIELKARSSTGQEGDFIITKWKMIDNWTQEEKEFEESVPIKTTKESPSVLSVHKVQIAEDDVLAQYDKTFILTAKAERNGVQKDAENLEYRVTAPAQEPVVERGEQFYSLPADAPITIGVEASVENMVSDEVKYQWWMSAGELDNLGDDDIIEGANTAYIKIADKNLAPQEGVFNTGVGSFYCVVTNCVNGTEASIISDRIGVFPG